MSFTTPPTPGRMPLGSVPLGATVRGRFSKWGGGRHWEWDGVFVGEDEHGRWFYAPVGTVCSRPGMTFAAEEGWVSLIPHGRAWAASFYPGTKHISVYVDMTTVPGWRQVDDSTWEVSMVDLDLDVVLYREGDLFVDDEDEFEEHQVSLGYPPEVIALAEAAAAEIFAAIESGAEPFASVGHRWLADCEANPAFAAR